MEFLKYKNPGQNKQVFCQEHKKIEGQLWEDYCQIRKRGFLSVHTGLQSKTSSAVWKVESGIYVTR